MLKPFHKCGTTTSSTRRHLKCSQIHFELNCFYLSILYFFETHTQKAPAVMQPYIFEMVHSQQHNSVVLSINHEWDFWHENKSHYLAFCCMAASWMGNVERKFHVVIDFKLLCSLNRFPRVMSYTTSCFVACTVFHCSNRIALNLSVYAHFNLNIYNLCNWQHSDWLLAMTTCRTTNAIIYRTIECHLDFVNVDI